MGSGRRHTAGAVAIVALARLYPASLYNCAERITEVTMGGFNGAWLDRHGIRPSYLGLGGPPLLGLGVRPPRSVSHLYPLLTLMLRVLRCLQTQWLVTGVGLGH